MNPLPDVYGNLLVVRPPVPATVNKAGANYKSEVAHLEYSPRRAYDEWLSILDAIVACGGDAIVAFEPRPASSDISPNTSPDISVATACASRSTTALPAITM